MKESRGSGDRGGTRSVEAAEGLEVILTAVKEAETEQRLGSGEVPST